MSLQSPNEDRSNDMQSNNTGADQQYKTWDIVKATQVSVLSLFCLFFFVKKKILFHVVLVWNI